MVPSQLGTGKDLICFYCQQPGHKASLCPIRKAKLSGACYAPREEEISTVGWRFEKPLKSSEPDCKKGLIKDMWEVPEDIGTLQREDETLKTLFHKVVEGMDSAKGDKEVFILENDVLYAVADGVKCLVVPVPCR